MRNKNTRRNRAEKQEDDDHLDDEIALDVKGAKWLVRSGHSQPGYRGSPATQPASGCVEAGASTLGVVHSPPHIYLRTAPSCNSARDLSWYKDNFGGGQDSDGPSIPALPGATAEGQRGDGAAPMALIPAHFFTFPDQGHSTSAAGGDGAGPSSPPHSASGGSLPGQPAVRGAAGPRPPSAPHSGGSGQSIEQPVAPWPASTPPQSAPHLRGRGQSPGQPVTPWPAGSVPLGAHHRGGEQSPGQSVVPWPANAPPLSGPHLGGGGQSPGQPVVPWPATCWSQDAPHPMGSGQMPGQPVAPFWADTSQPPNAGPAPVAEEEAAGGEALHASAELQPPMGLPRLRQGRRLTLEHTYIQGQENLLCGLLEDLRRWRAVGVSPGLVNPTTKVFENAKHINRIRFSQGDEYDRLTLSIQAVQISKVTDVRNPEWSPGDMTSSPLAALAAAEQCSKSVVGAMPKFIQLPTIGRVVEVGEILATLQSYRGDPVTITSPELVRPKGCEMVSELFRLLNVRRRDLVYQIERAQGLELRTLEDRFAALRNEYGMLYCLVCYANARLIGPWRQDWQPPYMLGPRMLRIVESLGVTEEQRWQLKQMRECCKDIIITAKSARTVSTDIAFDWAYKSDLETDDQILHFLKFVEAAEEARFMIPAAECMVAQAALSNILSPLQSARMVVYGYMLYMSIVGHRYQAVDFWRFMAACFLDPELGCWLDDAQEPPAAAP